MRCILLTSYSDFRLCVLQIYFSFSIGKCLFNSKYFYFSEFEGFGLWGLVWGFLHCFLGRVAFISFLSNTANSGYFIDHRLSRFCDLNLQVICFKTKQKSFVTFILSPLTLCFLWIGRHVNSWITVLESCVSVYTNLVCLLREFLLKRNVVVNWWGFLGIAFILAFTVNDLNQEDLGHAKSSHKVVTANWH